MLLDRDRLAQTVELSALDRVAQGAERMKLEERVAHLIQAAYTDATEGARADFMARVGKMPTSEWPWTAVRATTTRPPIAPSNGAKGGVVATPRTSASPLLLVLLRGQAESADVDPGNRLPDRGTPEAVTWEPLYRALDAWDTQTIMKWIGPQGGGSSTGMPAGQPQTNDGATSGAAADSGGSGSKELPVPQPAGDGSISWTHPAVLTAGAVVVVAAGVVIYTFAQDRGRRRLEDVLSSQEAP